MIAANYALPLKMKKAEPRRQGSVFFVPPA
jgi:hypothetical protein